MAKDLLIKFHTKGDLIIAFGDGSATLNGNEFLSGSAITKTVAYTLVLSDIYGNAKTIYFTV